MSKLNILNLLLSIVVISLAIVIYYSETENFELDRLTDIDPNSINEIDIKHNKNSTHIVKTGNDSWKITQPVSIAANSFRINSILKLINAPVHIKYALSEIDAKALGLSDSSTTIQLDQQKIGFGIVNPATGLRYVLLDGSVYTIEDVYYPLIGSHFSTLVSLNLLPDNSSIEKLVLGDQVISKSDQGLWQSTGGKSSGKSGDEIVKIIDDWKHAQAFGIHEYLERENLGEVSIYLNGQQTPVTYQITDTAPWLILARPELGIEYHLDIEAYDKLIKPM